jgi:endonuclease-3
MKASSSGEILRRLKEYYDYRERRGDPFAVLISTILSQRTKDTNTARASRALFEQFDTPQKLANADCEEIEHLIKPAGFYHVKAKRVKDVAQKIVTEYRGEVPQNIEELLSLEGVGRKTANCVLVYGFGTPAIPVDVHVHRIANRLGLVSTKAPEQTEQNLMRIFPKKEWTAVNYLFLMVGKDVCRSRNPLCGQCPLRDVCPTGQHLCE